MPRVGIFNMCFGFFAILLASSGGVFLSFDSTQAFLYDKAALDSWWFTLMSSAHGHTNTFGLLHICFGLTMPYCRLKPFVKKMSTLGLVLGTGAMSVLMMLRALGGPSSSFDFLGLLIGVGLSAALLALSVHCFGLALKFVRG